MKCKLLLVLLFLSNISGLAAYRFGADIPGTVPSNPVQWTRYAYDPTLLCEDGNSLECSSGSFKVWAHAGWAGQNCIDNIGYYLPAVTSDGYTWQSWAFSCNESTILCSGEDADVFAGPDIVKADGRQFLVFSHGSADVYNGQIQFSYRNGDAGPWSAPYTLFWISTDNITECDCFGGFARVAALDMPAAQIGEKNVTIQV